MTTSLKSTGEGISAAVGSPCGGTLPSPAGWEVINSAELARLRRVEELARLLTLNLIVEGNFSMRVRSACVTTLRTELGLPT